MVEIPPIRIEVEREDDGRILASVPDLPGVMAYGNTEDEAVRKVKSIALQVLADMIESGEDVPEPAQDAVRGVSVWRATKAKRVYAALLPWDGPARSRLAPIENCSALDGRTSRSVSTTRKRSAALAKIGKDTGLRPEDL